MSLVPKNIETNFFHQVGLLFINLDFPCLGSILVGLTTDHMLVVWSVVMLLNLFFIKIRFYGWGFIRIKLIK